MENSGITFKIGGNLGENGLRLESVSTIVEEFAKLIRNLSKEADSKITSIREGSVVLEVTSDEILQQRFQKGFNADLPPKKRFSGWNSAALSAVINISKMVQEDNNVQSVSLSIQETTGLFDSKTRCDAEAIFNQTRLSFGAITGLLYRVNLKGRDGVEGSIEVNGKHIKVIFLDEVAQKAVSLLGKEIRIVGELERKQIDSALEKVVAWEIELIEEPELNSITFRDLLGIWRDTGINDSVAFIRSHRDA